MKHDGLLLVVGGGPILGDLRAAFLANQSFGRPLSGYNQRLLLTQTSRLGFHLTPIDFDRETSPFADTNGRSSRL